MGRPIRDARFGVLVASIIRMEPEVNDSASFLFHEGPARIQPMKNIFTMVLAGGKGERLFPLTDQRAKPAVPFGGKYRIIDFTLSNCLNSGLRKIVVLIQYKSHSLDRHIRTGWNILNAELGEYIASVPPQQRISEDWYRGTADAVYQNMFLIDGEHPEFLLILAGDHVYKMNYAEMYHWLIAKSADAVVGAIDIPVKEATRFGVIAIDEDYRITRFDEKPANPIPLPNDPAHAFASMGIYLFRTKAIREHLIADAREGSAHDFGKNIIPRMIEQGRVYAFKFQDANKKPLSTGETLGRSTLTGKPTWIWSPSILNLTCTTRNGRSEPIKDSFHRPSSSSHRIFKEDGWESPSIRSSAAAASFRVVESRIRFCPRTSACKTTPMSVNPLSWKT